MSPTREDGSFEKSQLTIEDSRTTRWLDKEGNLVRIGEPLVDIEGSSSISYSFVIWDVNNSK